MKKLLKLMALIIFLNMFNMPVSASTDTTNPTLKIGLLYSSTAVPTTNLDNYTGSGHSFGSFDTNNNFIEVFDTDYEEITIMKDTNIYLGSDNLYYDSAVSSSKATIGAYHVQLSSAYKTASEAKAVALATADNAFVAYINGEYRIRVASYRSLENANADLSSMKEKLGDSNLTVVGGNSDTYTVTNTKTDKIIFEYQTGSKFGVMPKGEITWTKGYRYYGGFEYYRQYGGDITVINVVSMQDYVKGVIPYEMSSSWHIEALKAQALCARSYGFNNMNKHSKYGFDLCNDVDCQVYRGTSQANTNTDLAVDSTNGQYISYNGAIATAFFHSSDGGATENSENVWVTAIPYLIGVIDPYEKPGESSMGVWSTTITNQQIASILSSKGYSISGVSDMYVSKYTDLGNVYTLTVKDTSGKLYNFNKESARTILSSSANGISINSTRYRINATMPTIETVSAGSSSVYINDQSVSSSTSYWILGNDGSSNVTSLNGMNVLTSSGIDVIEQAQEYKLGTSTPISTNSGTYVINGRGWGHNVGMSQYGAKAMAEMGFKAEEIVTFYFTNTNVEYMG